MKDESLCYLTLFEMSDLIRRRKVSPVEVLDAHLQRCERYNSSLNAFITIAHEAAMKDARIAQNDIIAGRYRGLLHGIPIGIKDIFDTRDMHTTYGSSFYRRYQPPEDAAAVALLRQHGAVVLGKCNTHEFAAGSTTNNPWYGAAHNPWDLARSPGGSSGGSGAAVAAFLCPGATGTDTGGSIRNPAACNGVVGLKPTYGRVSLQGVYPLAYSLDHAGPLCRNARDCALLLQGMAGYVKSDPFSVQRPVPEFGRDLDGGVKSLRLGFCPDLHFTEVDEAVAAALEKAGLTLQEQGAALRTVLFPLKDIFQKTCRHLFHAEVVALHRERFAKSPEGYGEDVRTLLKEFSGVSVDAYVKACQDRQVLRRAMTDLFEDIDALLLPSAPCVAPFLDGTSHLNGKPVQFGAAGIPLRQPFNVVGLPAVSVPIGFSQGLPLGMQIVGPAWEEGRILRICHAYENATPELRRRRPPNC